MLLIFALVECAPVFANSLFTRNNSTHSSLALSLFIFSNQGLQKEKQQQRIIIYSLESALFWPQQLTISAFIQVALSNIELLMHYHTYTYFPSDPMSLGTAGPISLD